MPHIRLLPILWAAHAGQWIDSRVLSPFQLGTTAKDVLEEELGVFGVLTYIIFKVSRVILDAWPLFEPHWPVGSVAVWHSRRH
ncbi:MAG: hypothetical protein ACYCV6_18755 [Steroidobacteraceae bacterium]